MSHRVQLWKALTGASDLLEIVQLDEDGQINIHEASSLTRVPPRPFMAYRMHTDFPLGKGFGRREYCQLWAHDDPGDYLRIDRMLDLSRLAVEALPSEGTFLEARWIETGVDLRDDLMGTIMRYIRFQFTATLRERE